MAADVSSLVRMVKEKGINDSEGQSRVLITRDLLGGCFALDSKELDLDLQVPTGWEKRLDLKSGKVFVQRSHSPNGSSFSADLKHQQNETFPQLQDLNFPPPPSKQPLHLFDDASLDLKLDSSSSNYQSVCTLDKVKSALERAGKETGTIKKRSMSMSETSSPSSYSVKENKMDYEDNSSASSSFAAGCPSCLLYVLISKNNPACPRCNTTVPSPIASKRPRIDLNRAI
ncbi:hypothetical protein NMG60_11001956 [Bertholletia excelsa]